MMFTLSKIVDKSISQFFLNRAQLIARKGRERTKDAPKDVALDKVGRCKILVPVSVDAG